MDTVFVQILRIEAASGQNKKQNKTIILTGKQSGLKKGIFSAWWKSGGEEKRGVNKPLIKPLYYVLFLASSFASSTHPVFNILPSFPPYQTNIYHVCVVLPGYWLTGANVHRHCLTSIKRSFKARRVTAKPAVAPPINRPAGLSLFRRHACKDASHLTEDAQCNSGLFFCRFLPADCKAVARNPVCLICWLASRTSLLLATSANRFALRLITSSYEHLIEGLWWLILSLAHTSSLVFFRCFLCASSFNCCESRIAFGCLVAGEFLQKEKTKQCRGFFFSWKKWI